MVFVGLQEEAGKFFFFLLTLVLVSLTSASIGFAIGAGISILGVANRLIALSFVIQLVSQLNHSVDTIMYMICCAFIFSFHFFLSFLGDYLFFLIRSGSEYDGCNISVSSNAALT